MPAFRPLWIAARLTAMLTLAACALAPLPAADIAPASAQRRANSLVEEPATALRKFTVAPGLKVDLFAAEPDVRNPVAISIDERGRVFVVESDRRRSSVFDIRGHKDWLEADFSFRTVAERAEFLKQQLSPTNPAVLKRLAGNGGNGNFADFNKDGVIDWRDLSVQSERIRLLEDTNGDGRADRASVFADGFTNIVAGVAAGVLAQRGDVYFACIPDLWRLRSSEFRVPGSGLDAAPSPTRNPKLEARNLLTGFGVHIAFGGHDMHGLIMGHDGKLYWSIADRGTDTNLFSKIKTPWPGLTPELLADSGCIFRANPDGTDFEVVACGLRNPQELAFDEFGNLFTADNNGDGGDKARWHYVVEGADFGWRIGWQWLEARAYQPKMGPWNGERLWHLAESNTAAYLLPPLAHIGHGPAGLAYNPGTGLPPQFDRHFFLCDFPGHVLMWTNIPDGASFKAGPVQNFFGDLGPTDVAFHPDGGVLVSDWFKSFDKSDKGRLYRIHDPATDQSAAVQETKRLLAEGMAKRSAKELAELLGHRDMRVRLEAQSELVERGLGIDQTPPSPISLEAYEYLARIPYDPERPKFARLQAIRGQIQGLQRPQTKADASRPTALDAYSDNRSFKAPFLDEPDVGLRTAFATMWGKFDLGAHGRRTPESLLLSYLQDSSLAVRREAATGLGRLRITRGTVPLIDLLLKNADDDLYLRHAAVLALARIGDTNALLNAVFRTPVSYTTQPDATTKRAGSETGAPHSLRLGVLLALRRLGCPEVSRFLSDPDPQLVLEAARAINDVPIPAAYPQLAALLPTAQSEISNFKSEMGFFTLRRALNASFRLGHATNALALAAFAARTDAPEPLRIESLELLADWPKPPARDHFMGLYRPLPPRDGQPAADALRPVLASLLRDAPKDIRLAATRAATALGVKEADLFALVADATQATEVRVEALKSLAEQKDARLADAVKLALADQSEALRIEAGRWQGTAGDAVGQWTKILESGSLAEKQGVLASLSSAQPASADAILTKQLDALLSGKLAKELQLDVLDAATKRNSATLAGQLAQYESSLPKNDALAAYRPALHGGNAASGKTIFIENQQIACFRCHKINGEGGDVGPDLTGMGAKQSREYLLESIVQPNKLVAAGFESVLIDLKDGASYAGLVKSETDTELVLNSPEDGLMTLQKADIKSRQRGLSAMPEELATQMTRRELRDLIEFLASSK